MTLKATHRSPVFTTAGAAVIIVVHGVRMRFPKRHAVGCVLVLAGNLFSLQPARAEESPADEELHIQIAKKGIGKQVVITQRAREWFMLVEVTPENTVVIRQEKDGDRYLLDESETHDRPLTPGEVDAAVADYVNSVKARVKRK
jgi:hypothetical protein